MKKFHQQKGFTLVELAIVLTIVGLLIGGILKGQQLMQNSRVTATVAQINGFEAATTNFRDAYGALPGDLPDANTRINGCTAFCSTAAARGDGKVGGVNWNVKYNQSLPGNPDTTEAETVLFWYELQQAGLIAAVTDEGLTVQAATFGGTLPAAKVGGGWWVGNVSGIAATIADLETGLGRQAGKTLPPLGTVLVMVAKPDGWDAGGISPTDADKQPLTPAIAAQMDRKIDDGVPDAGQVHFYGKSVDGPATDGCVSVDTTTTAHIYAESNISKDCGLILRIQR